MKASTLAKAAFLSLTLTGLGPVMAQDQLRTQDQLMTQDQLRLRDQIYAYDYMTQRERDAYLQRQRQATSDQERERLRLQHQERMDQRIQAMNRTMRGDAGSAAPNRAGGMGPRPPIIIPKGKAGGRN